MEKKLIFVGMANREIAFMFMNTCIDSLHNSGVSIRYIDHERMIFRTPHTEVRYICFDRCSVIPDGCMADVIFGRDVYRTVLRLYAKPDVEEPGEKRIGLVEYICQVEQEATVTQIRDAFYDNLDIKNIMIDNGATEQQWAAYYEHAIKPFQSESVKCYEAAKYLSEGLGAGLRANTISIDEIHNHPCDVPRTQIYISAGRRNGKSWACLKYLERELERIPEKEIDYGGENNMNRNVFVNTALYAPIDEVLARAGIRSGSKPLGKLPGIKTVHFSGPVTAVIWEDGTKTLVRRKHNEKNDPEKAFAMAIAKKALGTNKSGSNYYDIFKQWLPKPEVGKRKNLKKRCEKIKEEE